MCSLCLFNDFQYVSRSMSGHHIARYGHQRSLSKGHSKDFTVATPEEFVKRFGGDRVINKVQKPPESSHVFSSGFYHTTLCKVQCMLMGYSCTVFQPSYT